MKNSLLFWYPKLKGTQTLTPRTEIVELNLKHDELMQLCDGNFASIEKQMDEIKMKANKIGYPLFMRTDETSNKHDWKDSCYVEKEEDLKNHIANLVEFSFMADIMGLPIRALVFRKYIPMKNLFTAFSGEMPINPEIRFFVKDGEVLCWHWYWVEDAIEKGTHKDKLPSDWKSIIADEKDKISNAEVCALNKQVEIVAKKFDGYWSIDFCKAKDDNWILIDMAKGHISWHPENCPTFKKEGVRPDV